VKNLLLDKLDKERRARRAEMIGEGISWLFAGVVAFASLWWLLAIQA
jgi:hypothetical protein